MSKIEDKVIATHRQSVGYLLAQAHGLFRSNLVEALQGSSLHLGHIILLASLYAQNNLTQAQLAQVSGIEKSSLVLFLDALEKDAWVERRSHPSDRRAYQVHLTSSGRTRFMAVSARLSTRQNQNLACLNKAEHTQLTSLLLKLIVHMEARDT